MNVHRMQVLADFLRTVPRKRFDMRLWGDPHDCGTEACALGWATTIPEFQAAGLRLEFTGPVFMDDGGFSAGAEFFGITREEAARLFSPGRYPQPMRISRAQVISRIESLIAKGETA